MKFETVKELDHEKFRRLAGVKRTTFDKMVLILEQANKNKKAYGGRNVGATLKLPLCPRLKLPLFECTTRLL